MSRQNKRNRERHQLHLPVLVTWKDESGKECGERARTQDISVSGCFVVCRNLIEKGCKVSVDIDLSIEEAGIINKHVSAQGRVVRNGHTTDTPKGSFGHGVKFDKFRFS